MEPGKNMGLKTGPGSLCFYGKSVNAITHIAMMINEYQVIEAGGGDSTTVTLEEAKKRGACVRVKAFGHRKDLVATILPNYPHWVWR